MIMTKPTKPPPGLHTFSIGALDAVKPEGDTGTTDFTFTVTRSSNSGTDSVSYAVTGAQATDFAGGILPSGTVTFLKGETSKVITIHVVGDTTFEQDESFAVTLSDPSKNTSIATGTATGTIQNDDFFALDAVVGRDVYLNDGTGLFTHSDTLDSGLYDVALGDLDGDGDTDAFVTNFGQPYNRVF
jgi:hypothetical protein